MQRLKDYAGFGVWCIGLGYIVMWGLAGAFSWPFDAPLDNEASSCSARALPPFVCALAHPQALPPLAHLVGLPSAIIVFVRLLLIALRSVRRVPDGGSFAESGKPAKRWRRPEPTVRRVKSRDHFGLRGLEH